MRTSWTGMISFGLVNIPCGIYAATEDHDISFHMLHVKDSGRIKNQRVCTVCGEVVAPDDLIKGFEIERGKYITVTDDDLANAKPDATRGIAISDFVNGHEIDPVYYDNPYYIVPGKMADTPYALLREALAASGKVAIAKIVLRSHVQLAAIRTRGESLMLYTMHFGDEVRAAERMPKATARVEKRELDMALMLIDAMTSEFDAMAYTDDYTSAVEELIRKKAAGEQIEAPAEAKQPTNAIDIMAQLKASLDSTSARSEKQHSSRKLAV